MCGLYQGYLTLLQYMRVLILPHPHIMIFSAKAQLFHLYIKETIPMQSSELSENWHISLQSVPITPFRLPLGMNDTTWQMPVISEKSSKLELSHVDFYSGKTSILLLNGPWEKLTSSPYILPFIHEEFLEENEPESIF